jgi:hypothetical protein
MKGLNGLDFVLVFSTVISGLLALIIIGVPVLAPLFLPSYQIPESIANWGGVIVGFYFGSFLSLINDIMKRKDSSGKPSAGEQPPTA